MKEMNVATAFLGHDGRILILKRSSKVGSFQGCWAGISGSIEEGENPLECAVREIGEEVGLQQSDIRLVSEGKVIRAEKGEVAWVVHPFLFETKSRDIRIDWEHDEFEWITPENIGKYETVPRLEETLESVLHARR